MLLGKPRTWCALLVVAFLSVPAVWAEAPASGASLVGKIRMGAAPAGDANVVVYHLSSEQVFTSSMTDAAGNFTMSGLPGGYYDVAVQTADGLFVTNRVVNLPPNGTITISVDLGSFPQGTTSETVRQFPGMEGQQPTGIASVSSKLKGGGFKRFVTTPTGTAVVAAGGALTLLAVTGGSDSSSSSPTFP